MSCKGSVKIPTAKHLAYLVQNITRKVLVPCGAARGARAQGGCGSRGAKF